MTKKEDKLCLKRAHKFEQLVEEALLYLEGLYS